MKRILFPTDFSTEANTAFVYALHFADAFDAEVVILHVYDLPIVETGPLPGATGEIFDIVETNQVENFNEQMPEMNRLAGEYKMEHVKTRSMLLYGDLVYTVNKVCKDEEIDLIVMGTKGASGMKETFLGSSTGAVMSNVPVPVLAVPSGAEYSQLKNIAFTTQYKEKDLEALAKALQISKKFDAIIHCLYIQGSEGNAETNPGVEQWKMRYSAENIIFEHPSGADIEQAILEFVERSNIDLIIMRAHKRSFFEGLFHKSLTKKMTYHSKVPILVYHEN